MTLAMAPAVFEPHMLANRRFYRDMQLLTDVLAHTVQGMAATCVGLLVVREIIFDPLTGQICRKGFAPELTRRALWCGRQARVR